MIKRFLLLCLLVLGLSLPVRAATGLSTAILTNFYGTHFLVTPNAPPTQVIKLKLFGGGVTIVTNTFTSVFNVFSNVTQEFNYTTNIIDNSVLIITNTTVIINGETNDLTQLWTNKSGVYEPTATNASTIAFGRSVDTWWVPSTADGFVNIHDQAQGESQFNTIALAAIDDAASTTNYALFTVNVAGGDLVSGQLRGVALTNWQDPNAPISKFEVRLEPRFGEAEMILINNGETNFWVTNNVTSVEAMRWIPHTNDVLLAGPQNIDVAHYSHVALSATNADPSLTDILLSAPIFDGTFLLLRNITDGQGFTLLNGSPLYDTPTAHVTLQGGTWVTTNAGDGLLLTGSPEGWSEVFRWTQNTNVQTSQLWELVSGHMRTVPETVDDWQFRYGGVPQLTVSSNGGMASGINTIALWGTPPVNGEALISVQDVQAGEIDNKQLLVGVYDGTNNNLSLPSYSGAYLWYNGDSLTANLRSYYADSTNGISEADMVAAADSGTYFQAIQYGLPRFRANPSGGLGGTPYFMDTSAAWTTNIFEVRNFGTNQLAFGPLAEIWFGEGGTNVLYRVNADLVYSNSFSTVFFDVKGTGADVAKFGNAGGNPKVEAATGKGIFLTPNAGTPGDIVIDSSGIKPDADNVFSVGTAASNGAFKDSYFKGEQHAVASNDGSGNYSWVRYFVTNGIAVFDFVNGGSGTAPTKFSFRTNGVQVGQFP